MIDDADSLTSTHAVAMLLVRSTSLHVVLRLKTVSTQLPPVCHPAAAEQKGPRTRQRFSALPRWLGKLLS